MSQAHRDWSKWRIEKKHHLWWVRPPMGSFWGRLEMSHTYDQARSNYIDQTSHFNRRAA